MDRKRIVQSYSVITRHVRVEGWELIGQILQDFLAKFRSM